MDACDFYQTLVAACSAPKSEQDPPMHLGAYFPALMDTADRHLPSVAYACRVLECLPAQNVQQKKMVVV